MEKLRERQLEVLDVVGAALSDLQQMVDPIEIEARMHLIMIVATSAYETAHAYNQANLGSAR